MLLPLRLQLQLMPRCGPQLFDEAETTQKSRNRDSIGHMVPRLDFSGIHGGAALRRGEEQQSTFAQKHQAVAQVAAPAEASPEALKMQPHAKPIKAACLGPLAMLPPKQPAMCREFTFVV